MSSSPFLEISNEQWIASNALAFAVLDGFPVSFGHALVITKRLVATWFEASAEEQAAVMGLVNEVKSHLDRTLDPKPTGYRTVAWDEKQIMELIENFESDVRNKPVENLGRTSPNPRILPLRDLLKAAVF